MTRWGWLTLAVIAVLIAGVAVTEACRATSRANAAPISVASVDEPMVLAAGGNLGYRYGVSGARRGPDGRMWINPYAGGGAFPDYDGDGKNDLLQDDDGDGIVNSEDMDWFLQEKPVDLPAKPAEEPESETTETG